MEFSSWSGKRAHSKRISKSGASLFQKALHLTALTASRWEIRMFSWDFFPAC
ncbi:MAG: transposase [Nitrospirae bacterium]|nr:transposase [Nitrospirota bacterium]